MRIQTTKPFDGDYNSLPKEIKERANKQLTLLFENPRHLSLGLKKIKGHPTMWESRITESYRFTFQIIYTQKGRNSRHPQDSIAKTGTLLTKLN